MKADERAERDAKALQLFIAGATYRQIGAAIGLRSSASVDRIIKKELANAARRRALLSDEAFAIHQERCERLFQAHWGKALQGDHKSALICQRLLSSEARLYGLDADTSLPAPTLPVESMDDDEETDELAKLRARRSGA